MINAAVLADPHLGPPRFLNGVQQKLTQFAGRNIQEFLNTVHSRNKYDFIVQLGDLIQQNQPATDFNNYRQALSLFQESPVPVHHLLGNHDTRYISEQKLSALLQREQHYYSFDVKNELHTVILFSKAEPEFPKVTISGQQCRWLAEDLQKTQLPTVIFVHHTLAEHDLRGNPWFLNRPEECFVENRAVVREILADSKKVIAVINGHLHWNKLEVHNDIPYITIQSTTENFQGSGKPTNSWAELQVFSNKIRLNVFGKEPFTYQSEGVTPNAY